MEYLNLQSTPYNLHWLFHLVIKKSSVSKKIKPLRQSTVQCRARAEQFWAALLLEQGAAVPPPPLLVWREEEGGTHCPRRAHHHLAAGFLFELSRGRIVFCTARVAHQLHSVLWSDKFGISQNVLVSTYYHTKDYNTVDLKVNLNSRCYVGKIKEGSSKIGLQLVFFSFFTKLFCLYVI